MAHALVLIMSVVIVIAAFAIAMLMVGGGSDQPNCRVCRSVAIPGRNRCPECAYPDPESAPEPLPEDFE